MGPRLFSRGNDPSISDLINPRISLQWGTTFQPWKSERANYTLTGGHSFNGATTFQPWKWDYQGWQQPVLDILLQWGHDFSAVEMHVAISICCSGYDASMGPRLFSRGNPTIASKTLARS